MRLKKRSTERARQLRRSETPAEKTLWPWLRAGRMQGFKFRRQHPLGPYFLDFGCAELKLAIELDGAGHLAKADYDAARDQFLKDLKWTVLRIGNDEVELRLHAVLELIVSVIGRLLLDAAGREVELPLSPTLSPQLRGEGES